MMEKLIKEMQSNVEKMVHEFELNSICKVATGVSHLIDGHDEKEFYGITVRPADLYEVIEHIETIILKDDADTIQLILDLFDYTITPNMLLTMTNREIMDEIAMTLRAYESSLIKFIYHSKGVYDNQELVFDYDKQIYIYTADGSVPVAANEDLQYLNNVRYEHKNKDKSTVRCRWYRVAEPKPLPTEYVSVTDMMDIISYNAQYEEDSDVLDAMQNILILLDKYNDLYKVKWDGGKKFVVIDPSGEKTYLS